MYLVIIILVLIFINNHKHKYKHNHKYEHNHNHKYNIIINIIKIINIIQSTKLFREPAQRSCSTKLFCTLVNHELRSFAN